MAGARPDGVTILAILIALGGIILILTGGGLVVLLGPLGAIRYLGVIPLLIGLIELFVAWGLWNGREWAWIAALIFAILDLFSIPIGTIIGIIILYYLTRPPIKAYFKH